MVENWQLLLHCFNLLIKVFKPCFNPFIMFLLCYRDKIKLVHHESFETWKHFTSFKWRNIWYQGLQVVIFSNSTFSTGSNTMTWSSHRVVIFFAYPPVIHFHRSFLTSFKFFSFNQLKDSILGVFIIFLLISWRKTSICSLSSENQVSKSPALVVPFEAHVFFCFEGWEDAIYDLWWNDV